MTFVYSLVEASLFSIVFVSQLTLLGCGVLLHWMTMLFRKRTTHPFAVVLVFCTNDALLHTKFFVHLLHTLFFVHCIVWGLCCYITLSELCFTYTACKVLPTHLYSWLRNDATYISNESLTHAATS
jgi:hypothetical protein